MRAELRDQAIIYHVYGKQFPLDDRRALVIEDLPPPKEGAFGEVGRLFVPTAAVGTAPVLWRAWPQSALGIEERDLVARATDSIRAQLLRTLDYRRTLGNQASAEDRRKGRELSRVIAHDSSTTKDLGNALLDMADRLSVGHDTPAPPAGSISEAPPAPPAPHAPGLPPTERLQ
jgi:hypothetical protein